MTKIALTDASMDRMDRAMLKRTKRLCRLEPQLTMGLDALSSGAWSFTGMVGLLPAILDHGTDAEVAYVTLAPPRDVNDMAHRLLASTILHDNGCREDAFYRTLDRIGRLMYRTRRIDGERQLEVHPIVHAYLQSLLSSSGSKKSSKKSSKRHAGGSASDPTCIIGTGKEGSKVFLARCIPDEVPEAQEICCIEYAAPTQRICGNRSLVVRRYGARTLLKVNMDPYDTRSELLANDKIYKWMASMDLLHLTSLHGSLKKVILIDANKADVRDAIALRQFSGDVSRIEMNERELVDMLKTVILVLEVIHANRHLHLDIKPKNILYVRSEKMQFALADFGILEDAEKVHHDYQKGGYSGTYGFMSPLLLPDDQNNNVFPVFKQVAGEAHQQILHWHDYDRLVKQHQASLHQHMFKIDMHSLGLTFYTILNKQHGIKRDARARCMEYIYALLFFGQGSISNTAQAMQRLQKIWS